MDIDEKFRYICTMTYNLDYVEQVDDIRVIEPFLVDMLQLIEQNPEQESLFLDLFKQIILGKIEASEFLIPFCMRTLKWDDFKKFILEEVNNSENPRYVKMMNYISHIMHAFEDKVWEQAWLWSYYREELEQ